MEKEDYLLRVEYCVFNVEQVEGQGVAKFLDQPSSSGKDFVDFAPAEEAIQATGADILFADGKAFYNPLVDYIQMPPKSSFENQVGYYATLAHELAHWTDHETRLARLKKNTNFGSLAYAFEELIAEVAGCFLCSQLNIPQSDDLTNHASYLHHWLSILQQDH